MTSQSFPVSCFLSRGFVPWWAPEVKFDAFGTSKHEEGKSLSKNVFAILISTLGRFNRANKKNICRGPLLGWYNFHTVSVKRCFHK